MPIKAALLASMSVPLFMQSFSGESHWKYRFEENVEKKNVIDYFFPKDKSSPKYYTGDILNKVPLELLSNKKIQKLINGDDDLEQTNWKKAEEGEIFFMVNFKKKQKESRI